MKKLIPISICIGIVVVFLTACGLINGGDPSLDATKVALAVMQTSIAQGQSPQVEPQQPQVDIPVQPTYTMYPTYTQQAPPQEEQPQEATPTVTITPTVTQTATQGLLFLDVTKDNIEFACHLMGYPTTLTITVEMSDVDRGAALFWRLHEKATDYKMDWTLEDMVRAGGNKRTYTFDADIPGGTANFGYPAIGESWFEFQIISNDGVDRTEVFADVTFHPCP